MKRQRSLFEPDPAPEPPTPARPPLVQGRRPPRDHDAERFSPCLRAGDLYVIPGGDPEDVYEVLRVSPGSALVRPRRGRHHEIVALDPKTGEDKTVAFDAPGRAVLVSPHSLVKVVGRVGA